MQDSDNEWEITERKITGGGKEDEKWWDGEMILTSINTQINKMCPPPSEYRKMKAKLIRDLRDARSDGFNPVPKNLPKEIFDYMLNRNHITAEGLCMDVIQLTIQSEDRGMSHWYIDSECGMLFLGDQGFPKPNLKEVQRGKKTETNKSSI